VGIGNKMNQMASVMQTNTKNASVSIFTIALKLVTTFVLSLTLSMIAQELFNYGTLSFVFVMIVTGFGLSRVISSWSLASVLIFDIICVLVGLLLRMYILLAP
jgi:hypothetical protein